MFNIIRLGKKSLIIRWASRCLPLLLCISLLGASGVQATTLESAFALIFEKLNANLAAKGEVVAVLADKNEVIIEYADDLVPAYGAELMVFSDLETTDETSNEATDLEEADPLRLVYLGSLTVNETAGHMNCAFIVEGGEQIAEGDQVFLPVPVQLYITPVINLTPNPLFLAQATTAIGRLLATFPGLQVFSLPASNQNTVNFLMQKCRNEGHYGLILQPYVVFLNGRTKAQLRMTSLFSGHSIGALEDEFTPFVSPQRNFR